MNIPSEDQEAYQLANYLRLNNYKSTHIWNESAQSWTKNIIIMMTKKKRMWVSKWFPDYCIILKRWALLFIELKRQRRKLKSWKLWASPSVISPEQVEWIKELNALPNIWAEIAYWSEDAIRIIEEYEITE